MWVRWSLPRGRARARDLRLQGEAIDVDFAIENLYAAGLLNVTGDLVSGEQVLSGYNSLYQESL
jgi:hypothetical protein